MREKGPKSYFKLQSLSKLNTFDLSLVVFVVVVVVVLAVLDVLVVLVILVVLVVLVIRVVNVVVVAQLVVADHNLFSCGQEMAFSCQTHLQLGLRLCCVVLEFGI